MNVFCICVGIAGLIALIKASSMLFKVKEIQSEIPRERSRLENEIEAERKKLKDDRSKFNIECIMRKDEFLKETAKAHNEIRQRRCEFEEEMKKSRSEIFQMRKQDLADLSARRSEIQHELDVARNSLSNLTAVPYMAGIIADFETHGLELLAQQLDWGRSQERAKKVISIRQIRKETRDAISKSKEAQYQLEYAIRMFPGLEDFLQTDYRELQEMDLSEIGDEGHDRTRNYLTKEEYTQLSTAERNQLALDRYRNSHRKTNWQIGRDYEYYIGYLYTKKGYTVEYFGSEKGLEDLGRDLIAKKDNHILIIQCKYWSTKKQIHEKHINQLYGTMIAYCFENNLPTDRVHGVLVTNITLSNIANRFSKYLGIEVKENLPLGEYPCIKCNINVDEYGRKTKIYHLPFDQQYDSCKIDRPGEFFALTTKEAEAAGFRRALQWYGS